MGLPLTVGGPISISVKPGLSAHRGTLLCGEPGRGAPVHAASFIRERRIVLERELFSKPALFRLILVHEIFHFVWPRLANVLRGEYGALLRRELERGARCELGESSAVRKALLPETESGLTGACWKDYVCESFCDTAGWLYAGVNSYVEFRLAARWREARAEWFRNGFERYWGMRCL